MRSTSWLPVGKLWICSRSTTWYSSPAPAPAFELKRVAGVFESSFSGILPAAEAPAPIVSLHLYVRCALGPSTDRGWRARSRALVRLFTGQNKAAAEFPDTTLVALSAPQVKLGSRSVEIKLWGSGWVRGQAGSS